MIKRKTKNSTERHEKKRNLPLRQRSQREDWGYHIFHYQARFEVHTESRHFYKASLSFSRDFIGDAGCDEGADYQNQFSLLSSNGDGLEYCQFYGCYRLLVNLASRHARRYRGWLLGANKEPLSNFQIARLLHIPPKQMTKILKRFIMARLIEKIQLPDFNILNDEPPDDDPLYHKDDRDGDKKPGRGKRSQARTKAAKRSRARSSAQVRSPYLNGKAATGKTIKVNKSDNGNGQAKVNALERQPQDQRQVEPPAADKPPKPSQTDPGGSVANKSPSPLGSDKGSGPVRIGQILSEMAHRYDPQSQLFAGDVFHALGLSCSPVSVEGRRELGCFASLWTEVQHAGLSPPELAVLRQKAVADAAELYKRRTKYRNLSAVWTDIFNKRVGQ